MAQIGQASNIDELLKEKLRLTMPKARVTQVIDGETLIVNNTTTIHLPAIYIPLENMNERGEYSKRAKDFLEKEFKDKFVRIYQVRNRDLGLFNALGHTESYLVREDGLFAQQALVEQGMAFAYPTQSHFETADILYQAENKAQNDKKGFWSDENWKILTDKEALSVKDRFAIVEGVVKKPITRNNVIYLNFGDDWKKDFTVAMDSGLRREFSKSGINILQINGKKIRVRGWLREYNGSFIEIFHPSQIEVIENGL